VSDPWGDEGFGAENDWGEESLEADAEEDGLFDSVEPDDEQLDDEDDEQEAS
jgi:hypothetical protein